jgi:DNA (cytosine-5)-methyltransferase 1
MLFDDITEIDPAELPAADVWTAGFPCQDVSLARGNHGRTGLKGHHTSLFFELIELLEAKRPRVVLLENVLGLLNSHKGCDFAIILRELTKHGYAVAWRVLNARYFGAPQTRSRVFLVAWQGNHRKAIASLFDAVPGAKTPHERSGFVTPTIHAKTGAIVPETAYCVAATSGRHTGNDWSRSYISYKDRVRRPTPDESERLQGFPAGWAIPGSDYKTPSRGLDSDRYRAVGNAVAVPVVRWIAERIATALAEPKHENSHTSFAVEALQLAPDLKKHTETLRFDDIMQDVESGTFAYRWKGCGVAWGNNIIEGATATAPAHIVPSKFVDIIDDRIPDERYFLTANAAVGMLRRADSVGRVFFSPMREALENMVRGIAAPAPASRRIGGDLLASVGVGAPRAIQHKPAQGAGSGRAGALPVAD